MRAIAAAATERLTFFEAQARHRRAAERWSLACDGAVIVLAVSASFVLTPLLLVASIAIARGIHAAVPLPGAVWQGAHAIATSLGTDAATGTFLALLAPGTLLVLMAWLFIRRALLGTSDAGATLVASTRFPSVDRFEERQLKNVVDEMALAAGMLPPRVLIADQGAPNAAVAGATTAGATIIVTAETLPALDRDQTQALLAHAIAMIANGDVRLNLEVTAAARIHVAVMRALSWPIDGGTSRLVIFLPLAIVGLIAKIALGAVTLFVLVPMFGWMLRHRRYLADAVAVQLLRNPGALARALAAIDPIARITQTSHWAPYMFVVTPVDSAKRADVPLLLIGAQPPVAGRLERLQALGATAIAIDSKAPVRRSLRRLSAADITSYIVVAAICSPLILYFVSVAALAASGAVVGAYWLAFRTASWMIP